MNERQQQQVARLTALNLVQLVVLNFLSLSLLTYQTIYLSIHLSRRQFGYSTLQLYGYLSPLNAKLRYLLNLKPRHITLMIMIILVFFLFSSILIEGPTCPPILLTATT